MLRKSVRQVLDALHEVRDLLAGVDRRLDKVEVVTMVREPAAAAAAEAYEGLRRQVVASATERWAHLAQLAQMDAAIGRGADAAVLTDMVDGWLQQTGLVRVVHADTRDADLLFELVEDLGGRLEVIEPAYQDQVSGRVVRQGRARRAAVEVLSDVEALPAAVVSDAAVTLPPGPGGAEG